MRIINKPWGYEEIWAEGSTGTGYLGKFLHIKSNSRLSLQYHRIKEETIYVKSGTLYMETLGLVSESQDGSVGFQMPNKVTLTYSEGQVVNIKPFFTHRFCAKDAPVELIEVSTNYLEDVIRIEDDYERGTIKG